MNKYEVRLTHVKEKITFTPEEMMKRRESYYMLITSLNTVMYCIAQIGTHTLNQSHKKLFKDMHRDARYFLDNLFPKTSNTFDKEIVQDISFNNVVAATTVFALASKMPQKKIDDFIKDVEILAVKYLIDDAKSDADQGQREEL